MMPVFAIELPPDVGDRLGGQHVAARTREPADADAFELSPPRIGCCAMPAFPLLFNRR
jgi:hypothetical protein